MKITVEKENFLRTLTLCAQVITQKPSLPVLGNLLLTTRPGGVEISGTNLDTTIQNKIPTKVEEKGQVTVPARLLISFCQAAGGTTVVLQAEKNQVLVSSGKAEARLPTIPTEDYPQTTEFAEGETTELSRAELIEAVAAVSFCASPEEGRPIFTGILIRGDGKKLILVATDGYRLGKKEIKTKSTFNATIPAKALSEGIKALVEQDDETTQLSIDKERNQARINTKNMVLTTRLLDGEYPDYEKIIPTSLPTKVTVEAKGLLEAVRLASLFARDIGNVVALETGGNSLKISASTAQVGEAKTEINAKTEGEKIKIAFNSRFLLDSLPAIKRGQINLFFSGPTSAAILSGKDAQDLIYVVMPVRPQG